MSRRFTKLPVTIEAVEWNCTKQAWDEILAMGLEKWKPGQMGSNTFIVETLEGDHLAEPGDFIIKGVKGEFYPCKPDIFALTYKEETDHV